MEGIVDDKSTHCLPFILEHLSLHQAQHAEAPNPPPLFIGINGLQGAGKSTLVSALAQQLQSPPHNLPTLALSLDDLYLPHAAQAALAAAHPLNPLLQHRGQPGTHDLPLARALLAALTHHAPARIPRYDKSLFAGAGDRTAPSAWPSINPPAVDLVLLEGWSLGFRALPAPALQAKYAASGALRAHRLDDLEAVNGYLQGYDFLTDGLAAFIHLDAADLRFVYLWRAEQEAQLRAARGAGMSEEQVRAFVDAFMPAYELYAGAVRAGVFPGSEGRQLRLVLGRDRRVVEVARI
ncbi:MAG: hypothetical protein M1829_002229 [Trizodia sp. TS-e1964]|nr:MAG: hypothetical protein M1829_002229 [Trizodia sp. TS-e1964]